MEVVNLKSAITLRVPIQDRTVAFTTKCFRGERKGNGTIPEAKEHIPYMVHEITVDSDTAPWLKLDESFGGAQRIAVLWSNVLSTQYEKEVA